MKILIIAATIHEIKPLLDHFGLTDKKFPANEKFEVLVTGVGMTATAYALGRHLNNGYDLVVNLGIGGCFDKSIALGTVLNVIEDTFADLGAEDHERFLSIDDLNMGKSTYRADHSLLFGGLSQLKKVKGITVNRVHGSEKSILDSSARLSPVVESMEGAAVLYCCEQLKIPCLQIRSISNYVEPRNREAWQIALAISNLNHWAIDFLTNC